MPEAHPRIPGPGLRSQAASRRLVYLAALSMAGSCLFAALTHSGVHLTGAHLPVVEVAFFRALFSLLAVLPILLLDPGRAIWRPRNPVRQLVRGVVTTAAMFFWFYGLATVPLVDVVALSFSSAIFVTAGAALFLGERVGAQRWAAVLVGLAGAGVILRPGLVEVSPGSLSTLLGSALWASGLLMTKRLTREEGNLGFVVNFSVCAIVLLAAPTVLVWQTPAWWLLGVLAAMGVFSAIGHVLMSNALRLADATVTMPIDYTRLVWASLIGYLFFAEEPDRFTWIGAAMIIGASLFIAYRESRIRTGGRQRAGKAPDGKGAGWKRTM